MKRLGIRVGRVAALIPPALSPIAIDPSRLTPAQQARVAALGERIRAVGLPGLTDDELEEAAELSRLLAPSEDGKS